VDSGLNLVDTADVYSTWAPGHQGGESEAVMGRWFKQSGKRDRIVVATKLGKPMGEGKKGLSRAYMQRAVEDSLRRLQTDYIDLYQSHEDDPNTPLEETMAAFGDLMKQGKVRAIGASNYTATRLAEALEVSKKSGLARYETLQPLYNLYDRAPYEAELEPLARRASLGVIPYFSLASGFLSGKYRSEQDLGNRARKGMVAKYMNERGMKILDALDEVARAKDSTAARIALAWLMAQPTITAPLVSATTLEQWNDILQATKLQLSPSEMERLNQASA
jgi:aryl-alcohol dehydrogenase-like predicted oxidoreductase